MGGRLLIGSRKPVAPERLRDISIPMKQVAGARTALGEGVRRFRRSNAVQAEARLKRFMAKITYIEFDGREHVVEVQ